MARLAEKESSRSRIWRKQTLLVFLALRAEQINGWCYTVKNGGELLGMCREICSTVAIRRLSNGVMRCWMVDQKHVCIKFLLPFCNGATKERRCGEMKKMKRQRGHMQTWMNKRVAKALKSNTDNNQDTEIDWLEQLYMIATETSTNTGKHDPKILTEEIETTHLQNGSNTDHTEQADVEIWCDIYNQTHADM